MQEHTRKRILLISGLIIAILLGAWWYSGFSLEFMRFFAAEPGPTDSEPSPSTAPAGCYYQQVQCIQAPCNPVLVCPSPGEGQVKCDPPTQTVKVGVPAVLTQVGGDGLYDWFSPDGTPAVGSTFSGGTGVGRPGVYSVSYATPGTKIVTVQANQAGSSTIEDSVACTVIVTP